MTPVNVPSIANGQSLNNKLPRCCLSLILSPPLLHYNLISGGVCQDESVCEHLYPWLPALVLPDQFKATRDTKEDLDGRTHPDSLARSWSLALPTMPVFYSPVPEMQMGLAYIGGSVFTNNRTADSDFTREQEDTSGLSPVQLDFNYNVVYCSTM